MDIGILNYRTEIVKFRISPCLYLIADLGRRLGLEILDRHPACGILNKQRGERRSNYAVDRDASRLVWGKGAKIRDRLTPRVDMVLPHVEI
jgi:hypothetical protein